MASLRDATEQGAFDRMLATSEILIVDFYMPSCVICKKIEPMLAAISEKFERFIDIVKVNAEANLEIAARFDVRGVPTLLLLKQGELCGRKVGFMTTAMLRDWITPYIKSAAPPAH